MKEDLEKRAREQVEMILDGDSELREWALAALERNRDLAAIPVLEEAINSKDSELKISAMRALANIGGEIAAGLIVQKVFEEDSEVRQEAQDLIKQMGDAAVKVLRKEIFGKKVSMQTASRLLRAMPEFQERASKGEEVFVYIMAIHLESPTQGEGYLLDRSHIPALIGFMGENWHEFENSGLRDFGKVAMWELEKMRGAEAISGFLSVVKNEEKPKSEREQAARAITWLVGTSWEKTPYLSLPEEDKNLCRKMGWKGLARVMSQDGDIDTVHQIAWAREELLKLKPEDSVRVSYMLIRRGKYEQIHHAKKILKVLGANAIPQLIKLIQLEACVVSSLADCFAAVGKESIPPLVELVRKDCPERKTAANILLSIFRQYLNKLDFLACELADSNVELVSKYFHQNTGKKELLEALEEGDSRIAEYAADVLCCDFEPDNLAEVNALQKRAKEGAEKADGKVRKKAIKSRYRSVHGIWLESLSKRAGNCIDVKKIPLALRNPKKIKPDEIKRIRRVNA